MKPNQFEYLVDALKSLPSIGTKVAERIAYFLINQDEKYIAEFTKRILEAKNEIHYCKQCNNFSPVELCDICTNSLRDNKKLCIVSNIEDLNKIEQTNAFTGLYFVLNDEINVKANKKIESSIVKKLLNLLNEKSFKEVILATNFTINGEATALFFKKIINEVSSNTQIYRLAVGLPINSALDYADEFTLKNAIKNKTKY